jgi:DNA-binding LytR/AlgR family response regulator
MQQITVLLVDDEALALDVLETYLEGLIQFRVLKRCKNAIEALSVLETQQVDVMFLDIQMPGMIGTALLKSLRVPPKVVFTTAFEQYAVDGFDLNIVDYLLKPIPYQRFLKAIEKLLQLFDNKKNAPQLVADEDLRKSFIFIKSEKHMVKVLIDDILFVESLKNYVKIVTIEKSLITYQSITSMQNRLSSLLFVRVHRSFLVAVNKVDAFDSNQLNVKGFYVPIGRNYKAELTKYFKGKMRK